MIIKKTINVALKRFGSIVGKMLRKWAGNCPENDREMGGKGDRTMIGK